MKGWYRNRSREAHALAQPRSLVRVLEDGEEFDAALQRAIESEYSAISRATELISRYERLTSHVDFDSVSSPASESGGDDEREIRSA